MTLTELFTNIANAIRSATGATGKIKASDFPAKINAIIYRGAWGTTINAGGSVTIPAGYHNGNGKVSANVIHNTIIYETLNPNTSGASSKTYNLKTGKRYLVVIRATNTSQESCFTGVDINNSEVAWITNGEAYTNINFVPSYSTSLRVNWQKNAKPVVIIVDILWWYIGFIDK